VALIHVSRAWYALTLAFITTSRCRYDHVSHFTNEETKAYGDLGKIGQFSRGGRIQLE